MDHGLTISSTHACWTQVIMLCWRASLFSLLSFSYSTPHKTIIFGYHGTFILYICCRMLKFMPHPSFSIKLQGNGMWLSFQWSASKMLYWKNKLLEHEMGPASEEEEVLQEQHLSRILNLVGSIAYYWRKTCLNVPLDKRRNESENICDSNQDVSSVL